MALPGAELRTLQILQRRLDSHDADTAISEIQAPYCTDHEVPALLADVGMAIGPRHRGAPSVFSRS